MTQASELDRRSFLAATGGATLYGASAARATEASEPPRGLLIASEDVREADALGVAVRADVRVLKSGDDPVRFWAREVAPALAAGASVYGVTRWSDYLVLRGLASESGRKLRFESDGGGRRSTSVLDSATALSIERFRTALAARSVVDGGGALMGWQFA